MSKTERKGYWYVPIVGTALDRRRQGLASRLTRAVQARAQAGGKPVWLETTTVNSRNFYAKHGFKVVEETLVGSGEVDSMGRRKQNGGVTIWGMVWRPSKDDNHKPSQ
jgi:ribosomal protein S18 acetylase RimI-like enzyme